MLAAAAAAFIEHGYFATRLSDIVSRTSLTKGAVYFHFASKDDLADALIHEHQQRVEQLIADVRLVPGDSLAHMIALTRSTARAYRDEAEVRAGGRLAIERALQDPDEQPPLQWWTETLGVYARRASRGGLINVSANVLASSVAAYFLATQHFSGDPDGRDAVRRIDQFWAELAPVIRR